MTVAIPPRPRGGYTLLELLLASVIAALLMAALYSAMDTHLRYAQSGRVTCWVVKPALPRTSTDPGADTQQVNFSDVHRITYWVDGGLQRQDLRTNLTALDDTTTLPPTAGDKLADEVEDLSFQYFDGT